MERVTRQATTVGASRTLDFAYDKPGNLTSKLSNVGADLNVTGYTYGTAGKPHRLTAVTIGGVANTLGYDANGNLTQYTAASGPHTWLSYDGRNNVRRIHVGPNASTIQARDEFWYTPDGDRYLGRESWDDAGTLRTAITTYLGAFEEVRPAANSGYALFQRVQATPTVQRMWRSTSGGATSSLYRLLHRDHLGSVDVVSDSAGAVLARTSFDPFGGRRGSGWGGDVTTTELNILLAVDFEDAYSPRGFTNNEQLNRTGFVHMNGRVYDPRIGRFVSEDPMVPDPQFSQSYNRYAYVFNSPLSYTDPSGYDPSEPGVKLNAKIEVVYAQPQILLTPGGGMMSMMDPNGGGLMSGFGLGGNLIGGTGSFVSVEVGMVREEDGTKLAEVKFSYSKGRESKKLDPPRSFYSASDGTVSFVGWESRVNPFKGWGFYLVIMTDDGESDLYAHIDPASVAVEPPHRVERGERLGSYADPENGTATRPHLHYERRGVDGKPKDPVEHALTVMPNGTITSPFGPRTAPTPGASTDHKGVDMVEMR